jgi:hypothetical protein
LASTGFNLDKFYRVLRRWQHEKIMLAHDVFFSDMVDSIAAVRPPRL